MSLLLVGMGLALTTTFFVGSPFTTPTPVVETAAAEGSQPGVPAIVPRNGGEPPQGAASNLSPEEWKARRAAANVPEDKTLRVTIPGMKRVENATFPYTGGLDEEAFRNNAGVHLRGTGFPWQRVANVYMAGHRLGYVGTPSWLAFWDLNKLETGDEVYVTDSTGRRYVYRVFKEFVVDPEDVFVMRPLKGRNILTLQTCTLPDYSRRLIVQAELVEEPVSAKAEEDRS
jgi:sortase A